MCFGFTRRLRRAMAVSNRFFIHSNSQNASISAGSGILPMVAVRSSEPGSVRARAWAGGCLRKWSAMRHRVKIQEPASKGTPLRVGFELMDFFGHA